MLAYVQVLVYKVSSRKAALRMVVPKLVHWVVPPQVQACGSTSCGSCSSFGPACSDPSEGQHKHLVLPTHSPRFFAFVVDMPVEVGNCRSYWALSA